MIQKLFFDLLSILLASISCRRTCVLGKEPDELYSGTQLTIHKMETTTLVLFLIVLFVTVYFLFFRKTNLPPGPWAPIPFIGFAPNVAYALHKGEPLYKFYTRLGLKYGSVFSYTALGRQIVVFNDYKAIREAFQDTKLNDRGDHGELIAKMFSKTCKLRVHNEI